MKPIESHELIFGLLMLGTCIAYGFASIWYAKGKEEHEKDNTDRES